MVYILLNICILISFDSLCKSQKWDKKNGLPKSHSQTMVNSSRSRKQLQKGVILRKWNGDPLIRSKHGEDDESTIDDASRRRSSMLSMEGAEELFPSEEQTTGTKPEQRKSSSSQDDEHMAEVKSGESTAGAISETTITDGGSGDGVNDKNNPTESIMTDEGGNKKGKDDNSEKMSMEPSDIFGD